MAKSYLPRLPRTALSKAAALLFISSAAYAADGTWTGTAADGLWSTAGNWSGSVLADGSGFMADFSQVDITSDTTVHLDGPRTLTKLIFGDTDTTSAAGWILDNSSNVANVLTLAGTTPTITVGTGVSASIGSVIAGSAGLTTAGGGTLVLTGANTYTGGTNIGAGTTLQIGTGGAIGGGNIVNNGNLVFNQAAAITVPSATLSGSGNLSVTSTTGTVTVSSALNQGGDITLNAYTNTTVSANITAGGALSIQPGNGNNSGLALGTVTLTAASINLGVTGIGSGAGFGNSGGTLTLDTSAANGNIAIGGDVGRNGNVAPNPQGSMFASMVVSSGSGTITLSSVKAGYIANVSNTFNGAVVLANNTTFDAKDSSYNGGNVVGASATFNGTVDLGGKVLQGGTGTANPWGGGYSTTNTLTFNGTSVGNGTLGTGTATVVFNTAGSQSVGATITNGLVAAGTPGTVTKTGTGTTTFSGTNTYTGVTKISAGTLSVGAIGNGGVAGNLGAATNLAANLVLDGGTLQYTGATASTDRAFTITAAKTGTFEITNAGTNLTISGAGANTTGALTKTGSGTLTLSGANAYTGATTVTAGTLNLSNTNALGSSTFAGGAGNLVFDSSVASHAFTFGGLSGTSNLALQDNAASPNAVVLTVGGNNANTTYSGVLSGAGSLTKTGTGALSLTGANTYTGSTIISQGTLKAGHATALGATTDTLTLGDANTGANTVGLVIDNTIAAAVTLATISNSNFGTGQTITINAGSSLGANAAGLVTTLNLTGNQAVTIAATNTGGHTTAQDVNYRIQGTGIAAGTTALILDGTSIALRTSQLGNTSAASDFTGDVLIKGNVTTQNRTYLAATAANQNLGFLNNDVTVNGGATWTIVWGGETTGALNGTGNIVLNNQNALNNIGLTAGNNNRNGSYSGNISGSFGFAKVGSGTQALAGTNSYSGNTTVSAGTLRFAKQVSLYNNSGASWTATKLVVESGATAAFNVGGTGEFTSGNIDSLKALGTATGGFKNGAALGLDTTNAGGNFAYASAIADTNAGANALGLTKLGAGTLTLSGANTYTGATTVSAGNLTIAATTGSIRVGAAGVTIASGATLTVDGTLVLTAANAALANAGAITLGGSSVLDIGSFFNGQADGSTYHLISGTTSASGTFSAINWDHNAFSNVTFDNAAGTLSFTAVPEPSTYGLIGAGALGAAAFVRRRRRARLAV